MTAAAGMGLVGLVVFLIAMGQPVYVLMGSIAGYLLIMGGVYDAFSDLTNIVEMTRRLADNDILLAIPFFIVAGAIMTEGDIANRLIEFAKSVFGWLPGGLAISATFACVFFAAISGSSPVTVIAIGSIMYPALVKEGYGDRFSGGLVTSAGSLGILIPPSIPMIVYAIVDPTQFREPERGRIVFDGADLSVIDLFLAGVGPGILIALIFSGFAIFQGMKRKVPRSKFKLTEVGRTFKHGFWALLLPVIILGGIYSGAFNATPAACVAVVYSLIVERFIHRSITFKSVHKVFTDSTLLIGALLLILALAQGFNAYLYRAEVATKVVDLLHEANLGPVAFLLIVNVLLLAAGCVMDILSAILILVPLLAPIAHQLGIHPLHLGIIFIVNLEIGYLTPPLGINLFVASTLFNKTIGQIIRAVLPFTALMLAALLLVTYVPAIALGPVSLYHGGSLAVPFPEPYIPMREMSTPEELQLLSNLAPSEGSDSANAGGPRQVLTLEEIMNQQIRELEAEAVQGLHYDSMGELLYDFREVSDGNVRIRDLIDTP
jgi:C4-dicarboxylate transporter DctM subunit